jgi:hypothetical protein
MLTAQKYAASAEVTAVDVPSQRDLADGPFIIALLALLVVGCFARFYHLSYTPHLDG